MNEFNEKDLENLRVTIGDVLTPDLLRKDWKERSTNQHHTYGHCYVAAEALFYILGGVQSEWKPMVGKDDEGTHWWLYSERRKRILDPSKEQYLFVGEQPPYETGRKNGFLTNQPSKRAMVVIDRVKEKVPQHILNELIETSRLNGIYDFI